MNKLEQRQRLINEIIQNCYSKIKITNKSDSAIMGYCVELAYRVAIFEDGTIFPGFVIKHRNNEQWRAEELVREVIKEIKGV